MRGRSAHGFERGDAFRGFAGAPCLDQPPRLQGERTRTWRIRENDGFEGANDIAIVGMAARVPGARNIDEYWRNLKNGVESVRTYTEEELLASGEPEGTLRQKNWSSASAAARA